MSQKNFMFRNVIAAALVASLAAPVMAHASIPTKSTTSTSFPVHDMNSSVPQDHVRVSFHNWEARPHYLRIEGVEVRIEANSTRTFDIPLGTPVYIARATRHHVAGDVLLNVSDMYSGVTVEID